MSLGIMTFSVTIKKTVSITTFSIKTLKANAKCHYAECPN
jgi:hypothetical protein